MLYKSSIFDFRVALLALAACGGPRDPSLFNRCADGLCEAGGAAAGGLSAGGSAGGGVGSASFGGAAGAEAGRGGRGGAPDQLPAGGSSGAGSAGRIELPSAGASGSSSSCMTQVGSPSALSIFGPLGDNPTCSLSLGAPLRGMWFAFDDGSHQPPPTALITAQPTEGERSRCSVIGSGAGATIWGGGIGLRLNGGESLACPFDATAFRGLNVTLSGSAVGTQGANYVSAPNTMRINLATTATSDAFGTCQASTEKCNDHFGAWCTLGSEPASCQIAFDRLSQRGWGTPKLFSKARLLQIEFLAARDAAAATPTTWSVKVDSVEFYL